jgi:hypothetical protein
MLITFFQKIHTYMSIFAIMVPRPSFATFEAIVSTDVNDRLLISLSIYSIVNAHTSTGDDKFTIKRHLPGVFFFDITPIGLQWIPMTSASLLESLTRLSSFPRYSNTTDWFLCAMFDSFAAALPLVLETDSEPLLEAPNNILG